MNKLGNNMIIKVKEGLNLPEHTIESIRTNTIKKIDFCFFDDALIGYLCFRKSNAEILKYPEKKWINRKIILDKSYITSLKKWHYYSLKNISWYMYSPTTIFVKGELSDLTDQVSKYGPHSIERHLTLWLRVFRTVYYQSPLQQSQEEYARYPEKISWFERSKEDHMWQEWKKKRDIWIEEKEKNIPKDNFLWTNFNTHSIVYEIIEIVESSEKELVDIDFDNLIASIKIPKLIKVKKYEYTAIWEIVSEEILVGGKNYLLDGRFSPRLEKHNITLQQISGYTTDIRSETFSSDYSFPTFFSSSGWSQGSKMVTKSFYKNIKTYKILWLPENTKNMTSISSGISKNENNEYIAIIEKKLYVGNK